MPDGSPLILGSKNNTASLETRLVRSGGVLLSAFHVENSSGGAILGRGQAASTHPPSPTLNPYGVWGDSASGDGVYGASNSGNGVSGRSTNGEGVFGISSNAEGVLGVSAASSGISAGVRGVNFGFGDAPVGVFGQSANGEGVSGFSPQSVGVSGVSFDDNGVYGYSDSPNASGVYGENYAGGYGVAGRSGGLNPGPGVYAELVGDGLTALQALATFPDTTWAGIFNGGVVISDDLYVLGDLTVTDYKMFRIDHPLDPAGKYLNHFSVESPEVKNVYDGIVELDEHGQALVGLPDYFEALNTDFRYQLTAVGAPGPDLYISEEISNNRFKIAGGRPGSKICWQVTGVRRHVGGARRRDEAAGRRIAVEEEKLAGERGYYLHPELYGEPEARRITLPRRGARRQLLEEEHTEQIEEHHQRIEELRRRMEGQEGPPPEAM